MRETIESAELVHARRIGILFLASNIFVIILTVIPVLVEMPDVKSSPYPEWYSWSDIIRLLEPIVALPFQILLFLESGYLTQRQATAQSLKAKGNKQLSVSSREKSAHKSINKLHTNQSTNCTQINQQIAHKSIKNQHTNQSTNCTQINQQIANLVEVLVVTLFAIFAAVYQQGAGFHSASNMFKHSIDTLRDDPNAVDAYPIIDDIHSWMRNDWEHLISHYMYAAGGILLSFLFAFLYRDFSVPDGIRSDFKACAIWVCASISYAIVIGSVAIQFIRGSIVALVLIIVYGFGVLGTFLFRYESRPFLYGSRLVIQFYMMSYAFALVIVVGWMAKNGLASRNQMK